MDTIGYQTNFLGDDAIVDSPSISFEFIADLVVSEELREGFLVDYLNYTVAMNKVTRQAFYSAGNADFANNHGEGRDFRTDSRVEGMQLGDIYYKDLPGAKNPYDRGHLTRRDAISWGDTAKLAHKASRDSCYFTNVSLQHQNFNQDEWYALEKAIEESNVTNDKRFNIFVGPVFTALDRFIQPLSSLEPARIPSAFWKLIIYKGTSGEIETNAFLVVQDDESMKAKKQVLGNGQIDPFQTYQTSTTLIEQLTGIEFSQVAFASNPMLFFDGPEADRLGVSTPQLHKVTPLEDDHKIIFSQ